MSLRDQAQGRWFNILTQLGIDKQYLTGKHGPCPVCQDGKDRFRFTDYQGGGEFFCNTCGSGNGYSILMGVFGWDFEESVKRVAEVVDKAPRQPSPLPDYDSVLRQLLRIGNGLRPIEMGDPVQRYLAARGLVPNDYLRIHPRLPLFDDGELVGEFPAMVALLQTSDGERKGYHRTYLTPEKRVKRVVGRELVGASIQLCEPGPVLGLAEGIETAMSVTRLLGIPCWAAYCASNMKAFEPPEGVKEVRVFGDTDASFKGQLSAVEACAVMASKGINVSLQPFLAHGDWNDKLIKTMRWRNGTTA